MTEAEVTIQVQPLQGGLVNLYRLFQHDISIEVMRNVISHIASLKPTKPLVFCHPLLVLSCGHHALAWCPGIMPMVQDKHNTAVRIITKAIASGPLGDRGADSIVYNDGGNAAKWARSGAAHLHKTVGDIPPADLLSKAQLKAAGSRPDIVLYRRKSVRRTPEGQWMTSQAHITLIEVKYTRDTDPSRTHQDHHSNSIRIYIRYCDKGTPQPL